MKIAIDARLYGLENAGLGRYTIELLNALSKTNTNHEFVVFLPENHSDIELPNNFSIVPVSFRHYSISEQVFFHRLIKKHSPDLTHFLHFNVPLLFKEPFVVTIHDMLMHKKVGKEVTTLPLLLYFIKRVAYKKVFKHAVYGSKKILVPTRAIKEEIIQSFGVKKNKITITNEGVNAFPRSKDKSSEVLKKYDLEKPYFFYAGNAYPHKNLNRVIEAVKFVNECSHKKALLAITTPRNVFYDQLKEHINTSYASDYVRVLPFIPDSEMSILHKNSSGYIFASLSEGFGLPGLEAMNEGALLAASDIPVFREVYGENAIYFNPFDFSSIAKVLEEMLSLNKDKRQQKIKKAKTFVKKYNWKKTAEETLKVYNQFA